MEKALVDFAAAQVGTTPVAISKARPHKRTGAGESKES